MELYTWMLGNRFEGVSMLYKCETSPVKKFGFANTCGLSLCAFGNTVEIIKNIVMPVNRNAQLFRYSFSSVNRHVINTANTYRNQIK